MHKLEYHRVGAEPSDYDKNVEYLRERSRAAQMGCAYNLPPEPSKTTQRLRGGFKSEPRDTVPADREPEPLPDCELSEIQLAEIRAREGKIVSVQGNNVIISDGDRQIQAYCHDVVHEGETVFYVVIEQNQFTQKFRILGKRGDKRHEYIENTAIEQ